MNHLAKLFVEGLPSPPSEAESHAIASALDTVVSRCAAELPDVQVDLEPFVTRLATLANTDAPAHWLQTAPTVDLYLARACANGDPGGLAHFDREVMPRVRPTLARLTLPGSSDVEERLQEVRQHLLIAQDGRAPRIGSFEGVGPLVNWIRTAAVRLAISRSRRARPDLDATELLSDLEIATGDPELDLIRQNFRQEFRWAFPEALAVLDPADRTALRLHYLDDVSLEEIGLLYGVHKSNVSRRLARAREQVLRETRLRLKERLALDDRELDSLMRVVEGELELSIETFLR